MSSPESVTPHGEDEPRAVARAFFAALDAEQWSAAAALIDPETAARSPREQMMFARMEERTPRTTPEALQRQDPEMSPEAAEYMAHTFDSQRELNGIQSRFTGIRAAADLEALSPQESLAMRRHKAFAIGTCEAGGGCLILPPQS